jgi:CBS domain-containing protein
MKAIDIMTRNVITAAPEIPVEEAVRLMLGHNVSGLPVIDDTATVVGIVTEGDLLRRTETGTERQRARWLEFLIAPGLLAEEYMRTHGRKVGEVMTAAVISVTAQTPLAEIVALMESRRIKRLPVIENGRLIGIISRADLLRALAEMLPKSSVGPTSDADIRRRVVTEIGKQSWAPHTTIDAAVQDGIVELRGTIRDERIRRALRVAVDNVPGVKQMVDHLVRVEMIEGTAVEIPAASPKAPTTTAKTQKND